MKLVKRMAGYFRHLKKSTLIRLAVIAGCLFLAAALYAFGEARKRLLYDQQAAARWSLGNDVAQVSIFLPEDLAIGVQQVPEMMYHMEEGLKKTAPDADDAESVFRCAYSAPARVTLHTGEKQGTFDAVACGGDFFLFHPLQLLEGDLFQADTFMRDGIVIDEDCAWQLFGGNHIIGKTVTLNGRTVRICGVVRRPEGRLSDAAGLSKSVVYLPVELLEEGGSTDSGTEAENNPLNIAWIEWLLPNPVRGFALQQARDNAGFDASRAQIIDNTDRFSFEHLAEVGASFATRSMLQSGIRYPYWENLARGWEDVLSLMFFVRSLLVLVAVVLTVQMIVRGYRHKQWTVGGLVQKGRNAVYDAQARVKSTNEKWKYF